MRKTEFNTDKLQHYRLISRVLCAINNLKVADFDLLIYLNPIGLFTIHDFKDGTFILTWDKKRFYRLSNEGWIKKIYEGRGYLGGHNKYKVSQKTKLMLARLGRIIDGSEDLPEIKRPKNYAEKILNTQVNKFNNKKYRNYE